MEKYVQKIKIVTLKTSIINIKKKKTNDFGFFGKKKVRPQNSKI
jgi:hypothetical protein